jgi:hypothetical protein
MRVAPAVAAVIAALAAMPGAASAGVPATRLVSRADGPDGRLADTGGMPIAVSGDGRDVLFITRDPDLTATHGTGGGSDFDNYVRDTEAGRTELVSRETGPTGAPISGCLATGMSADARYVTMTCESRRLIVRDRVLQTTSELAPLPNSYYISAPTADGRHAIVGGTDAMGIVAARVDLATGAVEYHGRYSGADGARASLTNPGALSANGRFAVFGSEIQDLETPRDTAPANPPTGPSQMYVRDLDTGQTILASRADGADGAPAASPAGGMESSDDGKVLFSTLDPALNGTGDHVLVRDTAAHRTEIVDRNSQGEIANGSHSLSHIAANGRYVVFASHATNLDGCVNATYSSLYLRDLVTGTTRMLSRNGDEQAVGDPAMNFASLSEDGRFIAYLTGARELDPPNPSDWAQVYEIVDAPSVLSMPERGGCSVGGAAPTCLDRATLSTPRDQLLVLPPAPCSDQFGRPLTITVVSGPSHGTLSAPFANGQRTYTPAHGFVGTDVIRYQASNGARSSNVAELDIVVTGVDDPLPRDATAPHVKWLKRPRLDKRGRAHARLRCDEPCVARLRLTGRARKKTVKGPARAFTGTTLDVTLTAKRHRGRLTRLRVVGTVRDAAGNTRKLSSRVKPRRVRR